MSFLSPLFLGALAAAAGPPLIHLMNRRRYRTVQWAAMDFLQAALRTKRKSVELRDLLLMLLRTLLVILFVLAMARPLWTSGQATAGVNQPVHAVIVVDNSLSMGYQRLDKTLLGLAKDKAAALIDQLPSGSAVSLVATCLPSDFNLRDVFRSKQAAKDGLESIGLVDRPARAGQALERAKRAAAHYGKLPNKRFVFIGDRQRVTWSGQRLDQYFDKNDSVQLVDVSSNQRSNTSVSSLRVRDGFAGSQSPAIIQATITHQGSQPRHDVRVSLAVNDVVVDTRVVDLVPGQKLELMFKHQFDVPGQNREPKMTPVTVRLSHDRLAQDDQRSIVVPVVESLPVVFIDRFGQEEDPRANLYGQTYPLRRLLGVFSSRGQSTGPGDQARAAESGGQATQAGLGSRGAAQTEIAARHLRPDQVTQQTLADARMVVVAGIQQPSERLVDLLHQYTAQGGMLLIGAGGEFDPGAWDRTAWRKGQGILPLPLKPQPIGQLPTNSPGTRQVSASGQQTGAFHLDPSSFTDAAFDLGLPKSVMRRLLSGPFFFKAVAVDESATKELIKRERQRLEAQSQSRPRAEAETESDTQTKSQAEAKSTNDSTQTSSESETNETDETGQSTASPAANQRHVIRGLDPANHANRNASQNAPGSSAQGPHWLKWANPNAPGQSRLTINQRAQRARPRIMGRYDNGEAFAVRRSIGQGSVVMVSTGFYPRWNSLAADHAVILLDQLMRHEIKRTLPSRDLGVVGQITIPTAVSDVGRTFTLDVPNQTKPITLSPEALGKHRYALLLREVHQRGIYRIHRPNEPRGSVRGEPNTGSTNQPIAQPIVFAVNGTPSESDLTPASTQRIGQSSGQTALTFVQANEPITLAGQSYVSQSLWKWLLTLSLLLLLTEMTLLAFPHRARNSKSQTRSPNLGTPTSEPAI